ncbi:MAG: glycoside hydrolase family 15 protein [Candidatus Eiseniibacteriota bacterium]
MGKEAPLARAFIVGNGSIVATGDRRGALREFYAPFVAPEHQWLRRPANLGVALDGRTHWFPADVDGRLAEGGDAPIVDLSLVSPALGLEFWIQTYVDAPLGVLVRRVQVANRSGTLRDLRLLFHHDLNLGAGEPHETALRDTVSGGILHQAARRCALIQMETPEGCGVPYWKVASRASDDAPGAETLAHGDRIHAPLEARGRVDSLAGAPLALAPGAAAMVTVWIATGATLGEARERDEAFRRVGVAASVSRTRAYWNAWLAQGARDLFDLPEDVAALYRRSLVLLRLHQAPSGAIVSGLEAAPEAPSRPDYRWCWHRDAAIAADALGQAGYPSAAQRYFEFAAKGAADAGSLSAAVETDGAVAGAAPDITSLALSLWALARHVDRTKDVELSATLYRDLAVPAAERLVGSIDPPVQLPASHDLWGERAGFHASSAVAVRAGLKGAARLAARFGDTTRAKAWSQVADQVARALIQHLYRPEWGRFARSLVVEGRTLRPDPTVDASLLWPGLLEGLEAEDTRIKATVAAVRGTLWVRTGIGGIARYERDPLGSVGSDLAEVPGNPWIEATLWMAEHAIQSARRAQDLEAARTIFLWCAARAEGWSLLPEQLHPYRGETTSSTPSLLAHAWFVEAVVDYVERLRGLTRCDRCGAPAASRAEREPASRSLAATARVTPEV